jgi:hypothetical protein
MWVFAFIAYWVAESRIGAVWALVVAVGVLGTCVAIGLAAWGKHGYGPW